VRAYVDAVEVCDAPVALRDVDVLELAVHVVLRFDQLAAVCLPGVDLNRYLVALRVWWSAMRLLVSTGCAVGIWVRRTVDSLRSLIGMPIVDVMVAARVLGRIQLNYQLEYGAIL